MATGTFDHPGRDRQAVLDTGHSADRVDTCANIVRTLIDSFLALVSQVLHGRVAAHCLSHLVSLAVQNLQGALPDPIFGRLTAHGVENMGGFPHVFEDIYKIKWLAIYVQVRTTF
jgi:hypothetical protein